MTAGSPAHGSLEAAITTLAGTPDHSPRVQTLLRRIPQLTVALVAAATHASITALRGRAYTTVAVSDELIQAIDDIQYAEDAGPCVDALKAGTPIGVPDIDATVQWPGFHEAAPRMGLHASVSVPLHAGRGHAVAVLNVYGYDRAAMAPLIAGIDRAHNRHDGAAVETLPPDLDDGGRELVTAYIGSLEIRAAIRHALEVIRRELRCGPDDAYLTLCLRAAEAGTGLGEAALALAGGEPDH